MEDAWVDWVDHSKTKTCHGEETKKNTQSLHYCSSIWVDIPQNNSYTLLGGNVNWRFQDVLQYCGSSQLHLLHCGIHNHEDPTSIDGLKCCSSQLTPAIREKIPSFRCRKTDKNEYFLALEELSSQFVTYYLHLLGQLVE